MNTFRNTLLVTPSPWGNKWVWTPLPSHECAYVILECSPFYPKLITTYTQPIPLEFGIQAQLNLLNKIHTKKGEKHANDQPNNNCDIFKYKDSDTTMHTSGIIWEKYIKSALKFSFPFHHSEFACETIRHNFYVCLYSRSDFIIQYQQIAAL